MHSLYNPDSLVYMCITFSSLLLTPEKPHYHHVVFLRGTLMVVSKGGKRVILFPSQRPFRQVLGFGTFGYNPACLIVKTVMIHYSDWQLTWVSVCFTCTHLMFGNRNNKNNLQIVFYTRRNTKRVEKQSSLCNSMKNTIRSRCDWQYNYHLHRSTSRGWSNYHGINCNLPL